MSKIIKLDKQLANQIAAGEVVERPVSIVKELIENSIDANASNIKIEIENGGIDKIIITDNGEGIEKEDIPLVIEKYSTSKIKNLNDLYNIMTFGFRGEAMASISSVSDINIISKNINENFGNYVSIKAGEMGNISKYPSENGTKIEVEKLFYNTPARLNYLKKAKTEYNHIYSFLQEISLSYPSIGFEFISDNKKIFKFSSGEDLKTRIYNIFGEDFFNNLININFSFSGINIKGYITDTKISFPNKNRQSLFVNKRVIKSVMIGKAISDAYNRYIPHNMYPGYILNIQIDPTQVDVNVHPRKLEVRFANEQNIFKLVYNSIQEKLQNISLGNINNNNLEFFTQSSPKGFFNSNLNNKENIGYTGSGTKFKSYSPYSNKSNSTNQTQIKNSIDFTKEFLNNENNNSNYNNTIIEKSNDLHLTPIGKIIGQAHNSYIIVETDSGIKFLDQHALAERIIYEKLINKKYINNIQGLLIGESISLKPKEINILENNIDIFKNMGFDIEFMSGNIIIINSIPDFIKKENICNIIIGILEDIGKQNFSKSKTLEEIKNKIFAYTACRSAIKFGDRLNLFEINKLLYDAYENYSSTCPHGRPVVFEINLNELKDKYER